MRDIAKQEAINHFFRLQSKPLGCCLEPTERCAQPSINAHSIPNAKVLSLLAQKGQLVCPRIRLQTPPPALVDFERVGRRFATTFTGLCATHDSNIFKPIDDALPDLGNGNHLGLLAYRAVLREYHVCLQNAVRAQVSYRKRIQLGLSPGHEPCEFGLFAVGAMANAYESYEYKRQYDKYYLESDWSHLWHHIIVLKKQAATIAVSSLFSLDDLDAPHTPRIALSVYPTGSEVVIVFSALPIDVPFVVDYLRAICSSEDRQQKALLSKLILQSCDNFVLSPSYYDALSVEQKDAIIQFYVDTLDYNVDDFEDERLYLF